MLPADVQVFARTARLTLRSFRPADAATFAAYRSDPAVAEYQGWDAPFPLEAAQTYIAELQTQQLGTPGEWYQIAIERTADGVLLGDCACCVLAEDSRQAEIGFTLASEYQGQGYASEAVQALIDYLFSTFDLHRIRAICDVANTASVRLLERVGMRREGSFIEHVWYKERWSSEHWYALLRREWQPSSNDVQP